MLQDESLEYIKEQFDDKNRILAQFGEQVSPWSFYEDIFQDMDMVLPVVIIDDDESKKIQPMSIYDALAFGMCRNDTLLGGCSYFNNWISKKSAKDIYTFIIDMDNTYSGTLLNALQNDWESDYGESFAKPTYIVNSGTGLHLYFVLKEPIPNYSCTTQNLDKLYRALAVQQSRRVYVHKQVQWFGQDFRIAGGKNKYDWENTVFRVGEKWDIDDLAKNLGLDIQFIRYGGKRANTSIRKTRKAHKKQGWKTNRAFYDYTLKTCMEKTKEGNRYMSMCGLSVIAWKCNVPEEELELDLLKLIPVYNKNATRLIKEKEVRSAMKMYNDKAMLTQRESIENWQGWEFKPIKRNGRKQSDHIRLMNFVRDEINGNKNWREGNGRPSKEQLVKEYVENHPLASVTEISKALGISRPTVYKYI